VVVGVQESKGYGIGFGIPTVFFGVAILAFIMGAVFKLYTCIPAEGSPFTRIFRVLKGGCQTLGRPFHGCSCSSREKALMLAPCEVSATGKLQPDAFSADRHRLMLSETNCAALAAH